MGKKAKRKNNDNNHDDDDNDNETLDLQTTQHTHASIICTENSPRKWNWIGNILNSFLKLQQIYLGLRKTNEWTIEHFVPVFFVMFVGLESLLQANYMRFFPLPNRTGMPMTNKEQNAI